MMHWIETHWFYLALAVSNTVAWAVVWKLRIVIKDQQADLDDLQNKLELPRSERRKYIRANRKKEANVR